MKDLSTRNALARSPSIKDIEQERFALFEWMISGEATAHDLVCLSFLQGMITGEQYADFLEIEKNCEGD